MGNQTFSDGSEVEKYMREDTVKTVKPWLAEIMNNYKVRELLQLLSISGTLQITQRRGDFICDSTSAILFLLLGYFINTNNTPLYCLISLD